MKAALYLVTILAIFTPNIALSFSLSNQSDYDLSVLMTQTNGHKAKTAVLEGNSVLSELPDTVSSLVITDKQQTILRTFYHDAAKILSDLGINWRKDGELGAIKLHNDSDKSFRLVIAHDGGWFQAYKKIEPGASVTLYDPSTITVVMLFDGNDPIKLRLTDEYDNLD